MKGLIMPRLAVLSLCAAAAPARAQSVGEAAPVAANHRIAAHLEVRAGTPHAVDERADVPATTTPFQAGSTDLTVRYSTSGSWELGLRASWLSVSVLQPGGSTVTERSFGNPVLDASRQVGDGRVGDWDLQKRVMGGIGIPLACARDESTHCGAAFALADALTGWSQVELYQRNALPVLTGLTTNASRGPWTLAGGLRLPLSVRISDEESEYRAGNPIGLLLTTWADAAVSPVDWWSAGVRVRAAYSALPLVEPATGDWPRLQLAVEPRTGFKTVGGTTFRLSATLGLRGPLSGSRAVGVGVGRSF